MIYKIVGLKGIVGGAAWGKHNYKNLSYPTYPRTYIFLIAPLYYAIYM